MPTTHTSTTSADHRIFGLTSDNQVRVNLYNGPGSHRPGNRYSFVWAKTLGDLAYKLEHIWEQPITPEEWDAIEELEAGAEMPCEDCAGLGYDLGAIGPDREPCPTCKGSGIEPLVMPRRAPAIETPRPIERGAA
jgi:hypothetical protein